MMTNGEYEILEEYRAENEALKERITELELELEEAVGERDEKKELALKLGETLRRIHKENARLHAMLHGRPESDYLARVCGKSPDMIPAASQN